ncbi:MAG: NADH-quinone oxidoreductase subunit N [Candidatus Omnitrophica bacterium]|nr:NADH-quinone oxidoreductase subunit N [Candidatus Omnitrophota bacterium]
MFPSIAWNLCSLECLIAASLIGLIIADIVMPPKIKSDWMGASSLIAAAGLLCFWLTQQGISGATFGGMFILDPMAWFFKAFFLTTMIFVFIMTHQFFKTLPQPKNELYLLLWLALLGMCLVASSADFILLFISLEMLTLSLYVMTAYLKSDRHSLEAGMKYLILGALSSGFFLYGISFLYGVTHSTGFEAIQRYAILHSMTPMVTLALVFIFAAIGFKIASVPFHLWVPDVYQGAPTPVTALLSVGSKAAGFVILMRLFLGVFSSWHVEWSTLLAALAAITMCYGNLGAMFQTNIKRLLGYSSIGHAGYLLMGAAAGGSLGASAINFYLLGYLFTNLAAFLGIILFSVATKSDELEDYAGLAHRSGLLAGVFLLALVSLAGVPPLVGFFGKFVLLMATVKSGMMWLALVAVVNIVISLYYYLMIVKRIYVDAPRVKTPIVISARMQIVLLLAMAGIIGIGIFQGPFMEASLTASKGLF